ncbi:MAG: hypothetical protein QM703_19400 [Gemmatales bacterium]
MPKSPKRQKIDNATALWKTMPTASIEEFTAAFQRAHKETISSAAVNYAKKKAGLTRKNKKSRRTKEITLVQMQKVHELAKQHGGVKALMTQLKAFNVIADEAGGYDALEHCLNAISELKSK